MGCFMEGLTVTGELTKANVSSDKQSFYLEIYFKKLRSGREETVFLSVALDKEHMALCPLYASLVNKQITVPVNAIPTKKGTIFFLTAGDGRPVE